MASSTATNVVAAGPRASPLQYNAPLGTRWQKEKDKAGKNAFEFPEDPKYVGPWMLGECVGKGASGRVRVAQHRRTGQLAAVKILPLQPIISSRADLATAHAKSEKFRLGVDKEIITMKLMNHPNIMRIYDVYEGEKELFLVLEYVQGGELFDFLVNRGRMAPFDALLYFKQIIGGLNYAHAFSIIHRDLKPENILIASLDPPIIKIADWGMAAFAPPSSHLETSCGSPHYASPEIVNGERYTGCASDIWSCGVILFALLTGRLPFDDKNIRVLLGKVRSGKYEIPSYVDPEARDLLTRMLVVDVHKRIKMSDILSHPWLRHDTPSIPYTPAPSLSELAAPITNVSLVDADLLESLRVLCGKHATAEMIKSELFSPSGHGTLVKAFYYLLNKHRQVALEGDSMFMDVDLVGAGEKTISKQYVVPISSRNQRFTRIRPRMEPPTPPPSCPPPPAPRHSMAAVSQPGSCPPPPPPPPRHSLAAFSQPSSRSRAASPLGPREPRQRRMSAAEVQTARMRPVAASRAHTDPGTMYAGQGGRSGPAQDAISWARPNNIVAPGGKARRVDEMPWTQSPPQLSVPFNTPQKVHFLPQERPAPALHAPVAVRPGAPGSLPLMWDACASEPTTHRTVNRVADTMNDIPPRPMEPGARTMDKEHWDQQSPRLEVQDDLSFGKVSAQSMGSYVKVTDRKDRKSRPPALDLRATSPWTPLSPTMSQGGPMTAPLPTPVASPVMGEFKGWFSNLFHFKQQHVLYSVSDLATTRDETVRLLAVLCVGIVGEDIGGRLVLRCCLEDVHDPVNGMQVQRAVRFRIEFSALGGQPASHSFHPLAPPSPVSPVMVGGTGTGAGASSAISRKSWKNGVASGYQCAIALVQEKGSVSTFRQVYQHMRADWRLDGLQSPVMPPTPQSPIQRFAVPT